MQGQRINISIAYTSKLFADGLEAIIGQFDTYNVIFTSPAGSMLFDVLLDYPDTQILIIQVNCPGKKDLDLIQGILIRYPRVKILLLSHPPRTNIGFDLLDSGISGYLLKSCAKEDVFTALKKITEHKPYICSVITSSLLRRKKEEENQEDYQLTEREKEVLAMLVASYTNKQIARTLNLSENTVKTHRKNIHAKFGVSNLLGMVRYACRSNLVDFGDDGHCHVCPHMN